MMNATNNWKKWLNEHKTNEVYNAHPDRAKSLCSSLDPAKNFEALTKAKNVVMITKAAVDMKIQATFTTPRSAYRSCLT